MESIFVCVINYHYENSEILGVFSSKESAAMFLQKEAKKDLREEYELSSYDSNRYDGRSKSLYIEEHTLEK